MFVYESEERKGNFAMPLPLWLRESMTLLSYTAFLYAAVLLGHGLGVGA